MFEILFNKRIDYFLITPVETGYNERRIGPQELEPRETPRRDKIVTMGLSDDEDLAPSYPNCTSNAWGREIISNLNPKLALPTTIKMSRNWYMSWLAGDSKNRYLEAFSTSAKQHFPNNAATAI